jgi:hypothetical protein
MQDGGRDNNIKPTTAGCEGVDYQFPAGQKFRIVTEPDSSPESSQYWSLRSSSAATRGQFSKLIYSHEAFTSEFECICFVTRSAFPVILCFLGSILLAVRSE